MWPVTILARRVKVRSQYDYWYFYPWSCIYNVGNYNIKQVQIN